jgi:hypothetical protein
MQRAMLPGLRRNAVVVLGNDSPGWGQAALADDVGVLTRALEDDEPDHVRGRPCTSAPRGRSQIDERLWD